MKRKLSLLVFLLLILIQGKVLAYEDSFKPGEVTEKYLVAIKSKTENIYVKGRMIVSENDKKTAYCLEPFEKIKEKGKYRGYSINDVSRHKIPRAKIERIERIAYFGYGYTGRMAKKWWNVTQLLIWKEIEPKNKYYVADGINPNYYNYYEMEQAAILNDVNESYKLPNISGKMSGTINDELTFTDLNNVLNNYDIASDVKLIQNNNTLSTEKMTVPGIYNVSFKRKIKGRQSESIVFIDPKAQNVFKPGTPKFSGSKFNFEIKAGRLRVSKVDFLSQKFNDDLKNVSFTLRGESISFENVKLDAEGRALFENIPYGKYQLIEENTPDAYNFSESKEIVIDDENNNLEITIENVRKQKKVRLIKYYEKVGQVEKNACFTLLLKGKELDKKCTNDEGIIEFILDYNEGEYQIKQLNSKEGYELVEDIFIRALDEEDYELELLDIKIPDAYIDVARIYLWKRRKYCY